MLRTTYIYMGMLYFSKGMFIVRKMMIPDEKRSILGNKNNKLYSSLYYYDKNI